MLSIDVYLSLAFSRSLGSILSACQRPSRPWNTGETLATIEYGYRRARCVVAHRTVDQASPLAVGCSDPSVTPRELGLERFVYVSSLDDDL